MRSLTDCLSVLITSSLAGVLNFVSLSAHADIINFSATLVESTCAFSLDKSILDLGALHQTQLGPSTLLSPQAFTLSIQSCTAVSASQRPVVNVTGDGITQDGKWLFRSSASTASNVGIMLFKTSVPPSFSDTEIKNGDDIPLSNQGEVPVDQNITFYAGLSCGVSQCAGVTPGTVTAPILFQLAYR